MTFENSNSNILLKKDNDNQAESSSKVNNSNMVISNFNESTTEGSSSSSRRRKGKPKKCIDSTLANGSNDIALPSSSTSLLGGNNKRSESDDSGIGTSLSNLVASLLPSTSSSVGDADSFMLPFSMTNGNFSPEQERLLQQLEESLNGSLNSTSSIKRGPPHSPSMIPPPSASFLATPFLPSLNHSANLQAHNSSNHNGSNKRKSKATKIKVEENPQPVQLPEGFEKLLEKAKNDELNGPSILGSRPPSANEIDAPPKKKRETGRCETKATIQGPDGKIVEGNYETNELNEFVKQFKVLRNKYGFTQGDVGAALGRRYGADFSQTTISRFEALNLSYKNMCKLRPLLEEWIEDIEKALDRGVAITDLLTMSMDSDTPDMVSNNSAFSHDDEQSGSNSPESRLQPINVPRLNAKIVPPLKRRRKRTNLDPQQKLALDIYYLTNPRPDYGQINEISTSLNLESDVIRVWFCNRRQKMRKTDTD